jgi:4-hydroxy-tetrahydrodipicolinate synthase
VKALCELPLDGLLVVTPAYVRPTQEGLYRHFAAVAEATRVPVIAYNVPSRTAVDLLPATVARLAQLPRLAGIKEAVPDMGRSRELVASCGEKFVVLSGDDPTAREAVYAGARGVISVTANVAPRLMVDMMSAALRGDRATADRIDAMLAPLHRDLFLEPNPIPAKWALQRMGLIGGGIRLPLTPFSGEHHAALLNVLRSTGALK